MLAAGRLREHVALSRATTTADTRGGQATTWAEFARVWAEVRPLSGFEALQAQALQATITHHLTLRYRSDIEVSVQHRVTRLRDGVVFEVVGPPRDPDGRRTMLTCDVVEVI